MANATHRSGMAAARYGWSSISSEEAELHADFVALITPRTILSLFGMPADDDALARRILHLNGVIVQFIGASYHGDDRARISSAGCGGRP